MNTSGLVLWGSLSALALTLSADACGGRAVLDVPRAGSDGGDDGSGSSGGASGSSSGSAGGSSGSSSGITGSSSGVSGGSSGSDGGGSGSSSGTSSSSGSSGSSSGISSSSSGSGSGSGGSPNGSIYLEQCSASFCQGQSFDVFAQFFTQPQGNGGCTATATSGACAYYSCSNPPPQNGDSAGTLTVLGPWLTTPVTITPMSGSNAYQYTSSSPGFNAGQTLSVSASGNVVPAFGPVSVVAPQLTNLESLFPADGGTAVVPTGLDLPIAWSGGQAGATMLLEAVGSSGQDYTYCSWSGMDGRGVIPAVTLKPFSGQMGTIVYGQYNVTQFSAGPYAITLTALPYTGGSVVYQ